MFGNIILVIIMMKLKTKVNTHQLKSVSVQYSIKILYQFIGFWTLLYPNFLCYFQIVVLGFQLAKRETLKVEFLDGLVIGSELPYAFDEDGRVPCSPHVHIWVEAWTSCYYFEVKIIQSQTKIVKQHNDVVKDMAQQNIISR